VHSQNWKYLRKNNQEHIQEGTNLVFELSVNNAYFSKNYALLTLSSD